MFTRILVATNPSESAVAVVRSMGALRAWGAEEILLLECLGLRENDTDALSHSFIGIDRKLRIQKEILESMGFKAETRIVPGIPQKEICETAEKENYSLIIAGARVFAQEPGASPDRNAYEIIHYCRKPILLVRLADVEKDGMTAAETARADFPGYILFPTDFSQPAAVAFETVKSLVRAGARKVTLLHVQDKARIDPHLLDKLEEFNRIDTGRLAEMKAALQNEGAADVDFVISYGSPSKEIIDFVREKPVQLIVMGSQGRGFVKEFFLGSVSHNVAQEASASVLLIPSKR